MLSMLNPESKHSKRFLGHAAPKVRLFVVATIIGVATGAAAAVLKLAIAKVSGFVHSFHFAGDMDWTLFLWPVIGIVLTGIYQRYVLKRRISHGVDRLVEDLGNKHYDLSPQLTYAPMFASTLTLGFGGSAGSEGPIAYTGAAIGSNIGRLLGLSQKELYILIGCGAGAGIAGIFKAPVGGALFTLEVLGLAMSTVSVIALFTATISAALTAYCLSGFSLDLMWTQNLAFSPSIMPWVVALGVFCGLYSVYYSWVMGRMKRVYQSIKNPWLMNLLSGATLGLLLVVFPNLYGEGYGIMGDIINLGWDAGASQSPLIHLSLGDSAVAVIVGGTLLVKCFACSASNCGGGVAGDFAPTLFAGCFAGLFFAVTYNMFMPVHLPVQVCAYIGMAAVMAGVIRAPLMATFLTAEMCNGFDYILPLVVVCIISYGMVMLVTHRKFYSFHHWRHKG